MAQAWAICPLCGKLLNVDPVAFPGEPEALTHHRKEHASAPVPPPAPRAPDPRESPTRETTPALTVSPLVTRRTSPPPPHRARRNRREALLST